MDERALHKVLLEMGAETLVLRELVARLLAELVVGDEDPAVRLSRIIESERDLTYGSVVLGEEDANKPIIHEAKRACREAIFASAQAIIAKHRS